MNAPNITIDLKINENGTLNVWVARESNEDILKGE